MSKDDKLSNDFLEMLSDEELYLLIDMLPYKPFFELIKNNPKEFKNETMGCTMNISSNMLKKRVPDILFNRIKRHDIPITNTVTRNTNTIISIVNKHIFKETSDEYFLEKTIESNDINNFIKLIDIILDVLKPEYIKLFLKLIGKELSDEQNDYIDTGMEITVMKKEIEHKVRKELEEEYRDQISEIEKIHRTEIANQVEKTKEIKEKLIAIEAELSDKKEHLNLLNNEIEKIKTEKSDEINKLQNHINKLNYKLNELEAERVGLKHSIQDKDSLIESLKNDLNMKNDEYIIAEKKWNSQNERLLNEQKSLEIKCKDLVQAKIMLDSSIKELETEKAQLEDKLSGYKNPTQTQSIKNITTNLYIKRNKIEDSPRNCNNINDFAENIATNLESTGIKDIDNVVANYIIGILAANMSPLICGYKAREIAAAISISYSGETPYIISLPNGYTNSKELLEIFNLAETNVVLIEDAVGTMNENALMPLLREKSEKGFSKKLLLLSTENLDSVKYMPTNLLNHVALVKINKYRANKKTGFEISDSREVLEQFIVLNSFKYESRIIKRLLHGLNFDSPYEMLRAIIVAYSSKLSNSKADLRGYLRSELMFICKCNNTVDVLEENIQKYQLDKKFNENYQRWFKMTQLLTKQMSSDLTIYKYNNESNQEYGNRLIYTALASWARTLVLGKSYTDLSSEAEHSNIDYHNVDIMHIQVRLTQIASGMLMTIPHCKNWIGNGEIEEQSSNLASNIIQNLIFCYELTQLNDTRRLTNSPTRYANFANNQLILGGEEWKRPGKSMVSVGLGRWIPSKEKPQNYKEIFNIPICTSGEYYNTLVNSAFWEESNLEGQYKVFKVGTGFFYKEAWYDFNISKLQQGIYLLKSTEVDGGYILAKKNEDKIFTARLDKWYSDENEIYRIMYAFDSYNTTPVVFKAKNYDDYILLHCHSKLPNSEMRILFMSSWPKRFYKDIYYRIIPKFIWGEIEDMLTNLGIKVETD